VSTDVRRTHVARERVGIRNTSGRRELERRLSALASPISAFWGQGLRVTASGETAYFNWREVVIPEGNCELSDEALTCLLLHEWGHRTLAPVTVARGYWWEILARLEGIAPTADAVNIACDLIIDDWYIRHPLWGQAYSRNELAEIHKRLGDAEVRARLHGNPLYRLLIACYASILDAAKELPRFEVETPLAEAALGELFDGSRTMDDRVRGFCRVASPVFREWARLNAVPMRERGTGLGVPLEPIVGRARPWRGKNWNPDELIRLLVSNTGQVPKDWLSEICGAGVARKVHARLRVLESLARVASRVEAATERLRIDRYEGVESWRVGEPLHELDAKATLERSGLILPGLTTVRKRRGRSHEAQSALPALCLVIDNSGSTQGAVIEGELDAAVALLEVARRTNVSVSAIVFGSDVVASVAPGRKHDEIEMLFGGLSGQSGGTALAPALRQAISWLPADGSSMGTMVFTDSYVWDAIESASLLPALTARGPVVLFCVEDRLDSKELYWLRSVRPAPRIVQYHPGHPLVDEALEVLA